MFQKQVVSFLKLASLDDFIAFIRWDNLIKMPSYWGEKGPEAVQISRGLSRAPALPLTLTQARYVNHTKTQSPHLSDGDNEH